MIHFSARMPLFAKSTFIFFFCMWGVLLLARLAMFALVYNGMFSSFPLPSTQDVWTALYIGAKFDARIAVFLSIPLGIVLFIPKVKEYIEKARYILDSFYGLLFALLTLLYIIDFGYFFYLRQRIDASLIDFLDNASISFSMIFQTYPVILIALAWIAVVALMVYLFDRLMLKVIDWTHEYTLSSESLWQIYGKTDWKTQGIWAFTVVFCLFCMAYGQISSNFFPLRWSNAYFSPNRDIVLLGLNPVQNLYDSISGQKAVKPDEGAVRMVYKEMAEWLRLPQVSSDKLDYWRKADVKPDAPRRNVCLIIMESLSWPMTSFAPGDDDTTPNLREIARDGIYFSNYYASARTTARAVFSIMTGIPDVNRVGGTTSRNPALVRQYIPMSDFKGYEKYYMLGGSASWANIRGVLQHNIPDLHLLEESAWKSPNVDVWGISDLSLFRESIGVLGQSKAPFFAVIQTAGFHRPYTIPKDNAGFEVKTPSEEIIKNYGFADADEYNSLRFSDHALGEFFKLASKQPWFKNTVFAIVGDHGLYNTSQNVGGGYLACALQGYHVPLVLYAPDFIKHGENTLPGGHADLFPTLASLSGVPAHIHGIGRDLLNPDNAKNARQFIAGDSELFRILVEDNYCYVRKNSEGLYRMDDLEGRNLIMNEPSRAARMRRFAEGYYQTSKYMLFNNKEQPKD